MKLLSIIATAIAFFVVGLGAFTRLTDAGLGCPDWPGCYGHILVQQGTFEASKAWTEMIHRYFAGSLGLLIIFLASYSLIKNKNIPKILPISIITVLLFQALLGMWTVTLKLLPMVVMGHLLGGMTLTSLLLLLTLYFYRDNFIIKINNINYIKNLALLSLIILIIQIALGGWTSSNYAALSCPNFPFCTTDNYFPTKFSTAFNIFHPIGINYFGGQLDFLSRATIQMTHRLGALITFITVLSTGILILRKYKNYAVLRNTAILILLALFLQILLGTFNVIFLLPLSIAVLHNIVALSLLLLLITLNFILINNND